VVRQTAVEALMKTFFQPMPGFGEFVVHPRTFSPGFDHPCRAHDSQVARDLEIRFIQGLGQEADARFTLDSEQNRQP